MWSVPIVDRKPQVGGNSMKKMLVILFIALFPVVATATTLIVPSAEFPSIQTALNASVSGDEVVVSQGTYYEHDIQMKSGVVLRSASGATATTIDAQSLGRVFYCDALDSQARIQGFTITNGLSDLYGGGIYCTGGSELYIEDNIITHNSSVNRGAGINCNGASPVIRNNVISYNSGTGNGGGIDCNDASPVIKNNIITNNSTSWYGGGIACHNSSPTISGNTVTHNNALDGGGVYYEVNCFGEMTNNLIASNYAGNNGGGGISVWNSSSPMISHNTIVGNTTAGSAGGIELHNSSNPVITNCIVAFNGGVGIACDGGSPTISCTNVFGNGEDATCGNNGGNNTFSDPMFCDLSGGNFELESTSPCLTGPCGQIGKFGLGCYGVVASEQKSWGEVKSLYR
jgi:parallel beta-helix repeat protein